MFVNIPTLAQRPIPSKQPSSSYFGRISMSRHKPYSLFSHYNGKALSALLQSRLIGSSFDVPSRLRTTSACRSSLSGAILLDTGAPTVSW